MNPEIELKIELIPIIRQDKKQGRMWLILNHLKRLWHLAGHLKKQ